MTIIYTARWVLPITSPPLAHGAVAVTADRISAVGPLSEVRARFPEAALKDLGEAALLPGLINVHSHLELTVFRGRLEEAQFQTWIAQLVRLKSERLTRDDLLASARWGCIEALRAGITTLADTADASAPLAALIESGQRGVVFQECFGPRPEQAADSLAELKKKLETYAQRLAVAGPKARARLRLGISPHAPYSVSAKLYEQAAAFALAQHLDVCVHAAESPDEAKLLRDGSGAFAAALRQRGIAWEAPGCSTVTYFHRLGVLAAAPLLIHGVTLDGEDIALLATHGARVAHCPKSNAKLGHGLAPLFELWRAGVRVGLGTDSVASNNTCDLIEEARFGALLHRAARRDGARLTPPELLRLMTIDGARALGLEAEIGSLEVRKQADLIAINLTPAHSTPHYEPEAAIIFNCSARDVSLTVVAGNALYEDGRVTAFDETEVRRQVRAAQMKLARA
jgi:cytosine/adenosine deaminase-related metal-dependent hydrolase